MSGPVLQAEGLDAGNDGRVLCWGLDLAPRPGECWGILGRNGSGKTTLLHTLAGLRPALAGRVLLDGRPLASLRRRRIARRLGLLPQEDVTPFPSTVLESVLAGFHPHLSLWAFEGPAEHARAREALATVDLAGLEGRTLDTLSGGERRRVALATLLVQDPAVMLLDEPTNHLDLHHQVTVLETLRERVRAGRTAIMVLHDLNLAARYCDRFLFLPGDGTWEAGPGDAVLKEATLSRLFGHPIIRRDGPEGPAFLAAPAAEP